MFVVPVVLFVICGRFIMNGDISGATASGYGIMIPLDIASYIAAWVLAIMARSNYKNTFSLVLIIIYASLLALSVIGIIALVCIMLGA